MNSGDNSARKENLQRKGQPQALRAMIQGSASTYASVLNATLFPFLLYQQSLVIATRVALGSLQAATGVAQRRIEAGDEAHLSPSARVLSPSHEEPATAEDRPPAQEEEASTDEPITQELPPPPEVPDVELHPPPPVPQNTLDDLPPPPEVPDVELHPPP